jgi:hypothetical protein
MLSDARYSPKTQGVADLTQRLARIDAYVAAHSYVAVPIEERLLPDEAEELMCIRRRASELRKDREALISRYRARTGEI